MKLRRLMQNCRSRTKPTKGQRCASQQNWSTNDAMGHFRQIGTLPPLTRCPLRSESGHARTGLDLSASCQKRTHAPLLKAWSTTPQLVDSARLFPIFRHNSTEQLGAQLGEFVRLSSFRIALSASAGSRCR